MTTPSAPGNRTDAADADADATAGSGAEGATSEERRLGAASGRRRRAVGSARERRQRRRRLRSILRGPKGKAATEAAAAEAAAAAEEAAAMEAAAGPMTVKAALGAAAQSVPYPLQVRRRREGGQRMHQRRLPRWRGECSGGVCVYIRLGVGMVTRGLLRQFPTWNRIFNMADGAARAVS